MHRLHGLPFAVVEETFEVLTRRVALDTTAEALRELIRELSKASQDGAGPPFGHANNGKEFARLVQVRNFGSPRTN
jgi:hypothetical protein